MNTLAVKAFFCATLLAVGSLCHAETIPEKPELLWKYNLGSEPSGAPSANSNLIITATIDGKLIALTRDGKLKWTRHIEGESFQASPSITDTHAIIGSADGTLYALDLEKGKTAWTYSTDQIIQSRAVSTQSGLTAVISQPTGSIYLINSQNGKLEWKSKPTNRCDGSPTAHKEMIIFGNCDAAIHVFSMKTRKKIHSIGLGPDGQVAGGVAIRGNRAAVGTHGGDVVYADIQAGKVIWTFSESEASTHATPAIDSKNVIAASDSGTVYCLDTASGALKWEVETDGTPTAPLLVDSRVIIGSDGTLYIFSLDSGKMLWSYEISDEITSPVLTGNMIIAAADDGTISAFGAK